MKFAIGSFVILVAFTSAAFAADRDKRIAAVTPRSGWDEVRLGDEAKREKWHIRVFRNAERNELLTYASLAIDRPRTFDDAWEFAPAGYPYWFSQNQGYSITPIKSEWLNPEKNGRRNRLCYVLVNQHESDKMSTLRMACGIVANLDHRVYYVQHTASHPITESLVRDMFKELLESSADSR